MDTNSTIASTLHHIKQRADLELLTCKAMLLKRRHFLHSLKAKCKYILNVMLDFLYKYYFHPYRNIGTNLQWAGCALVFIVALRVIPYLAKTGYALGAVFHPPWWVIVMMFLLFVAQFLNRFWSYRGTDLMLRPDGAKKWSVHMCAKASVSRTYYANTKKNFIYIDTVTVLTAAKAAGLNGVIVLKSHLFGLLSERLEAIDRLKVHFPNFRYDQRPAGELGRINARKLTKLRDALWKKLEDHDGKIIPDEKKIPMSKNDPVGVIEISIE